MTLRVDLFLSAEVKEEKKKGEERKERKKGKTRKAKKGGQSGEI